VTLTAAAQEGAFSDSAHFSRVFRQTFGMAPSAVLKPLVQVHLV
jgi:AraC-like DNA-binding protein